MARGRSIIRFFHGEGGRGGHHLKLIMILSISFGFLWVFWVPVGSFGFLCYLGPLWIAWGSFRFLEVPQGSLVGFLGVP